MRTVGVDLGGTNVGTVALDGGDRIVGASRHLTPTTGDHLGVVDIIVAGIQDALDDAGWAPDDVAAVGVGTPGVVIDGTVGGAANVPGFEERFPLRDLVQERVGLHVRVANDVTAAAVGEHVAGAATGADQVLCVFVGTGVGGGLILDGKPYEGSAGGAGEFGHLVIRHGGAVCPCGRRGCVEAYAGRRAMAAAADRAVAAGRSTILFQVMEEEGKRRATSSVFRKAFERGDSLVADLLDEAIDALGAGIGSAVNLLDLELVVLGGGLADKLGEPFRSRVESAMQAHLFLLPPRVRLVASMLGGDAGPVGAGILARQSC